MSRNVLVIHPGPKQPKVTDLLRVPASLSILVELPSATVQFHRVLRLRDSSVSIIGVQAEGTKGTEIRGLTIVRGSLTKVSLRADFVIDNLQPLFGVTIVGMCSHRLVFAKIVYRFCGRVVCYRCSASRHPIPQERVVANPFWNGSDDGLESPQLHRVCDTCVPVLLALAAPEPEVSSSSGSFGSLGVPSSGARQITTSEPRDSRVSELDSHFLIECPVCRTDLRLFDDEDLQAIHVATCLEGHSTSPSFNSGSRHVGTDSHGASG